MSDIQDPLVLLQQRMQQRQILAMMGIKQWVQPSSETINITDVAAPTTNPHGITQSISSAASPKQPNTEQASINVASIESPESIASLHNGSYDDHDAAMHANDVQDASLNAFNEQSPVTYSFDSNTPDAAISLLVDTVVQQTVAPIEQMYSSDSYHGNTLHDSTLKVAPFDLQGGRYGNWVILVDIQALNNDSQKLWQNITQALSISCETTSFPICEGMDIAELANASFAGYIFKIGRSEEIRVAALTPLPEGLEHPTLTTVPTLDEMLADNSLKRRLWEILSSSAD
ncbi:MAG TPA: hypothetical protein DCR60_09895 [Psychrobacter sp.]|nr:hypothetical protein [Psychrobacter sp.]|tara:strand:- start:91 stop:951 length:861 start_codon:yes stop_codon:yes gene_type:complete